MQLRCKHHQDGSVRIEGLDKRDLEVTLQLLAIRTPGCLFHLSLGRNSQEHLVRCLMAPFLHGSGQYPQLRSN
ncbi:hypothetical protein D3C71_2098470 [compost metagenome]